MPNLSIRNVPADIVGKLRERATVNHRSPQGELMALITRVVRESPEMAGEGSSPPTSRGHKSIEQIAAEHRLRVKLRRHKGGRSVDLIRADRDAR
jgi:plasmid stability protein